MRIRPVQIAISENRQVDNVIFCTNCMMFAMGAACRRVETVVEHWRLVETKVSSGGAL
jgi:hypothetical protein